MVNEMEYLLLNNLVSIENHGVEISQCILDKYVGKNNLKETKLKVTLSEIAEASYGIENIKSSGPIHNIFFSQKDYKQVLCALNKDYSEFLLSTRGTCSEEVFLELFMTAFYSYISMHDSLLMHASAVCYENNGIVFTASSGVGKTTQAELWAKYKNATILNGDKVFLKREKDDIHAWGSPWKGSSPYAENASAPLRAIVVLEQAEENSIRKLDGLDVLEYVVPHVFFPSWDERCEQAVLTFLDQVLEETEIYLLKCRPDESTVELLAERLAMETAY